MLPENFYLGTWQTAWLKYTWIPLFISHVWLQKYHLLHRSRAGWCLDSGAFSEVSRYGRFLTSPQEYIRAAHRYQDQIGSLHWMAPQDHMTEDFILKKSELASTVEQAQEWTTSNYLELRTLDADLPIIPVLQGQSEADYLNHIEAYAQAGIDLTAEPVVGVGSVCRRQGTAEIGSLIQRLHSEGLRLHGFGVKTSGLEIYGRYLHSADSMAWSHRGRWIAPCPQSGNKNCSNCLHFALEWRAGVIARIQQGEI